MTTFSVLNPGEVDRECGCGCECGSAFDVFEDLLWQVDPSTPWITAETIDGQLLLRAGVSFPLEARRGGPILPPTVDPPTANAAGGFVRKRVCCDVGSILSVTAELDLINVPRAAEVAIGLKLREDNAYPVLMIWTPTEYLFQMPNGFRAAIPGAALPNRDDKLSVIVSPGTGQIRFQVNNDEPYARGLFIFKDFEMWLYVGGEVQAGTQAGQLFAKIESHDFVCDCACQTDSYGPCCFAFVSGEHITTNAVEDASSTHPDVVIGYNSITWLPSTATSRSVGDGNGVHRMAFPATEDTTVIPAQLPPQDDFLYRATGSIRFESSSNEPNVVAMVLHEYLGGGDDDSRVIVQRRTEWQPGYWDDDVWIPGFYYAYDEIQIKHRWPHSSTVTRVRRDAGGEIKWMIENRQIDEEGNTSTRFGFVGGEMIDAVERWGGLNSFSRSMALQHRCLYTVRLYALPSDFTMVTSDVKWEIERLQPWV